MIRQFRETDIESICGVLNACYPNVPKDISVDTFRRKVLASEQWGTVHAYSAVSRSQVRGFAAAIPEGTHMQLAYLQVHPESRKQGIGGALLEKIEDVAKRGHCTEIGMPGFRLGSPFHGVVAQDDESNEFFIRREYSEQFRTKTRVLKLEGMNLTGLSRVITADYRFDIVSTSDSAYWSVRRAVAQLCSQCEPIFAQFSRLYVGNSVEKYNSYIAVAFHGLDVVGFCGFVPYPDFGMAYEAHPQWGPFLVHPDYRNRGIGRRLLNLSLSAMAELGCSTIVLSGAVDGPAAHLYETFGFKTVVEWVQYQKKLRSESAMGAC
jgi:GNAT superfamily N-acetyltransferase